ncbi:hypothetical protein Rrhod_1036 [Rhodococcus rhodnii LMG 5362]|uniref:Uncharacterized protein n=1 Tax=Rhodococcus rhodnii LMG 5362 TaxID=1273125 RepID=R7WQR2_9NOCA|nr:hypothetical protein Rrhod_1036 [Rhodococcus rhodnii LMG 5362]
MEVEDDELEDDEDDAAVLELDDEPESLDEAEVELFEPESEVADSDDDPPPRLSVR